MSECEHQWERERYATPFLNGHLPEYKRCLLCGNRQRWCQRQSPNSENAPQLGEWVEWTDGTFTVSKEQA